jgi:hypothetical protein
LFYRFPGIAETGKISRNQIVALLTLHLVDGATSHGGLDRVLHIRDVDLEARRGVTIHDQVQVRLSDHA